MPFHPLSEDEIRFVQNAISIGRLDLVSPDMMRRFQEQVSGQTDLPFGERRGGQEVAQVGALPPREFTPPGPGSEDTGAIQTLPGREQDPILRMSAPDLQVAARRLFDSTPIQRDLTTLPIGSVVQTNDGNFAVVFGFDGQNVQLQTISNFGDEENPLTGGAKITQPAANVRPSTMDAFRQVTGQQGGAGVNIQEPNIGGGRFSAQEVADITVNEAKIRRVLDGFIGRQFDAEVALTRLGALGLSDAQSKTLLTDTGLVTFPTGTGGITPGDDPRERELGGDPVPLSGATETGRLGSDEVTLSGEQFQPFGQAFSRIGQDVFGGLGGINPLQGAAFNDLARRSQAALPFLQAFSGFSPENAPHQFGGLPSREEAIRGFLGPTGGGGQGGDLGQILGNVFANIGTPEARSAIGELGAGRISPTPSQALEGAVFSPDVDSALRANTISPRIASALLGFADPKSGILDPGRAADIASTPFIEGLPTNLRGTGQQFLRNRNQDFLAANPNASIFDVLARFRNAGFF